MTKMGITLFKSLEVGKNHRCGVCEQWGPLLGVLGIAKEREADMGGLTTVCS